MLLWVIIMEYTEKENEIYESFKELISKNDYRPLKFKELCYMYEVDTEEKKATFLEYLNKLCDDVLLIKTKNNRYMLPPKDMLTGTFSSTRRGFGFVTVEGYEEDFFVSAKDSLNAFHGDKVLISVIKGSRGPRKEARIIRILSRNTSELIGVYQQCEGYGFVIPNNKKIADDIYIPKHSASNAVSGSVVIVTLEDFGDDKKSPTGHLF